MVCTPLGAVKGQLQGDTIAFKGIPYAQPPVGPLRWKPTKPVAPWKGVRDGSNYGPICPQIVKGKVEGNEDCLTLNVWKSAQPTATRVPVMVWLTGGGNHSYSGQGDPDGRVLFTGKQLVPSGVVFVSVNVRLGVLGFLAHPALNAERAEKTSGNYASLDQIEMLRWVRDNISAFGGDPKRVMLFGTSAGGGNTCALLSSPFTRGLIHVAAMQSSVPTGCELQTRAQAETRTGKPVVQALGCDTGDTASCLRSKTVEQLVLALPGYTSVLPRLFGPVVDGYVFPDQPIKRLTNGTAPAIPIIIGNTTGETNGWVTSRPPLVSDESTYLTAIDEVFGNAARERILSIYPLTSYSNPKAAFQQMTTDAEFTCTSRRVARQLSTQNRHVYRYLFDRALGTKPGDPPQAVSHTEEHAYLFAWEGTDRPVAFDLEIQKELVADWTSFAAIGNPNGKGENKWRAVTRQEDAYLEFGAETKMKTGPTAAHCEFWDTVPLPSPHL